MTEFRRMLPQSSMDVLTDVAKQQDWWRDLLDYRFCDENGTKQPLALAIRNGYLNAYVEGQSVLRIKFDGASEPPTLRAKIHHKYLGQAVGQKYKTFDGKMVDGMPYLPGKSLNQWVERARCFAKPRPGRGAFSEKQGIAMIVGNNPHVIDLEMALPGIAADRIDIVALERAGSAINIVFYEAKLFSNPGLKARNLRPEVLEQLDRYERWLTSANRMEEVANAYREACRLLIELRRMQGVPVDKLVEDASKTDSHLKVDPRPRLILFGYCETELDHHWTRHERALRRAGLDHSRLIMQRYPHEVRLSQGTFPEGCCDEAEDILASCEGLEMVNNMEASIRRHALFAIARFAPIFTTPGFQFATRLEQEPETTGAGPVRRFSLSETAYEFIEAACGSGWIELADWRAWSASQEAQNLSNPDQIATASEDQLGKLLTFKIRNDRFNPDTLNTAFERGILTAIVQRAQALLEA